MQEQFYNTSDADGWIKGTKALNSGRHQSGRTSPSFQIRKRSISRVRSILQVEVHQIIRGLVRKHQVHRVFSWRTRPFAMPTLSRLRVDPEQSDLEDGPQPVSKQMPRNHLPLEYQQHPSDPGLWKPSEANGQALASTRQTMSR